jgi:hypothetical protein
MTVQDDASRLDAATEAKKTQLKALVGDYVRRAEGANARVQALEAELAGERCDTKRLLLTAGLHRSLLGCSYALGWAQALWTV